MKRSLAVLAVLGAAVAGLAMGGPRLANTASYNLAMTNCDGGVTVTPVAGEYVVSYKDEGVYLCVEDAGCATGGQWMPQNLTMRQQFTAAPISCRSDGMTGDVSMTLVAPGT